MLKLLSGLVMALGFTLFSTHSSAAEVSSSKGACHVIYFAGDEPDNEINKSFNCLIEKKKSPYGTLVSLRLLEPNKQLTRVEILETDKDCDFNSSTAFDACGSINLYNNKKEITAVFSDMTVYANNEGESANAQGSFTKKSLDISTCSGYIGKYEAVTVCYKPNAKNRKDVAQGFN